MKKLMLLFAAMACFAAMNAQTGTFVVADGSETSGEVPLNTYYADYFLRCQTIYPEAMLAGIAGKDIQGITYYLSETPEISIDGTFEVRIGTSASASFGSEEWLDVSSFQVVYTGVLDLSSETMTINFTTPFAYTGGNLVIEVSETRVSSDYDFSGFIGMESSGASLVGNDDEDYSAIEPSTLDFIPKTGFIVPVSCAAPTINSIVADVTSATLSWTENGSASVWQYKLNDNGWVDITTPSPYTITGLTQNTEYSLQLRSSCGTDNESFPVTETFTTEIACADVVDAIITHNSQTAIAIEWTINTSVGGASTEVEVSYKEADATDWITTTTTGSNYVFTGLTEGTAYTFRIKNICGDDMANAVVLNATTPICGELVGSEASNVLPVYNYYNYSYTQFIYTANETGSFGSFDNISFYFNGNYDSTRIVDVYIADIDGASLSGGFIDIAEFTQVASDYEWTVTNGWSEIPLSSAFEHTAGKDIVVAINDKTGSYVSGYGIERSFACHSGSGAYLYNDNSAYNPENPGNANNSDLVPNIRFNTTCNSTCTAPIAHLENVTTNTVTVAWTPLGDESSWSAEYRAAGETEWVVANNNVTVTTYTFTNLASSSDYAIRIGANCGDQTSYASLNASTACDIVSVTTESSYIQTFDAITSGIPNCWEQEASSSSEWESAADGHSGRCLIFEDYSGNNAMLISPAFDLSSLNNGAQVRFWYMNATGYLGNMTASVYYRTSATGDWTEIPDAQITAAHYNWTELTLILPNSTNAGFYQLAIDAESASDYYYEEMYIDDFVVEAAPTCIPPTAFTTATTENSATLTWNSDASQFEVGYSTDGTNWTYSIVDAATATISGLTASTAYQFQVRAICTVGDTSSWTSTSASTACGAIQAADMPYFEGFEDDISCWQQEIIEGDAEWTINGAGYYDAAEGSSYVTIEDYSGNEVRLISPIFNVANAESLVVKFAYAQRAFDEDQDVLKVEYRLGPTSEWITLANYTQEAYNFEQVELTIPQTSATLQIAFHATLVYGYGVAIDSLSISASGDAPQPTCDVPTSILTSNLTANTVTVSWTGSAPQYEIEISGGSQTITETVTTNSFSTEALTPETSYSVKVRAICENGLTSDWSVPVGFTTPQPECDVPLNVRTTASATSVTVTWIGYATEYDVIVSGGDMPVQRTVTTNSCTIDGLTPSSTYNVKVRAKCDGQYTEWTEPVTFYTTEGGAVNDPAGERLAVSVYPNPATNQVTVSVEGIGGKAEVRVVDMSGRTVISSSLDDNSVQLNVSRLAAGTYFIRIYGEGVSSVRKLIVK